MNTHQLNAYRLGGGIKAPDTFASEMRKLHGTRPITKVEFVDVDGNVTDVSAYYLSGGTFEQVKERAPDEISAGDFDIVFANHDNFWSEYVGGSFLNALDQYHGAQIRVYQGFIMPDGTEEYEIQSVGLIDELRADNGSQVTVRCRDRVRRLLDETLNPRSFTLIPTADGGNTGNGAISAIETKPFKTKNETWTLTCTTPGGDSTAVFSVVGSVSGNVGNAASGTEFSTMDGVGGIKFTISAGSINWAAGDIFTFDTKQHPEWTDTNAGKIIWAILTGHNWDTGLADPWSTRVLDFDSTQDSTNEDIDYDSFVDAIAALDVFTNFALTGYIGYDASAVQEIQDLLLLFLGSVYTGNDGRIKISVYIPGTTPTPLAFFADNKKITSFGYSRTQDEVINYVSIQYKSRKKWEFTNETIDYQGSYVTQDTGSRGKYGTLQKNFAVRWYAANGNHVVDFAGKLIGKYKEPPLNMDLDTGMDAIRSEIGDPVAITDEKYGILQLTGEITKVTKFLDRDPVAVSLRVRREADLDIVFGYLGSREDEGDGLSPQADTYGTASDTDKDFVYLGSDNNVEPDYRMF